MIPNYGLEWTDREGNALLTSYSQGDGAESHGVLLELMIVAF